MPTEIVPIEYVFLGNASQLLASIKQVNKAVAGVSARTAAVGAMQHQALQTAVGSARQILSQSGQFYTSMVPVQTATEKFGQNLARNKMKLGELTKAMKDHDQQLSRYARRQAEMAKSQVISAGRDASGIGQAIVATPTGLDKSIKANMDLYNLEKQKAYNEILRQRAVAIQNLGKNTQWAGRQLMVGLTLPITIFAATAAMAFKDMDAALIRLQKVYGDGSTFGQTYVEQSKAIRKEVQALGMELAQLWGQSSTETIGIAADLAATGKKGADLIAATRETVRLSVLGDVDRQESIKATIALQSTFNMSSKELAQTIDFMNAVENQTSTTLSDLVEAIPRAGTIIKGLGGDMKDLSLYMTAMKEGGVNATEGANALKSGLASIINPTKQAKAMLQAYGINIEEIVRKNAGKLTPTIMELKYALDELDPLSREQAIAKLFGKWQFARMGALFNNLGKEGSQTVEVLRLMGMSAEQLGNIAQNELGTKAASASTRFASALETIKAQLAAIGESILPVFTFIVNGVSTVGSVLDNILPEWIKDPGKAFAGWGLAAVAITGPLVMLLGLMMNLVGTLKGYNLKIREAVQRMQGKGETSKFVHYEKEIIAAMKAGDEFESRQYQEAEAVTVLKKAVDGLSVSLRNLAAEQAKNTALSASGVGAAGAGFVAGIDHRAPGAVGFLAGTHKLNSDLGGTSYGVEHFLAQTQPSEGGIVRPHDRARDLAMQRFAQYAFDAQLIKDPSTLLGEMKKNPSDQGPKDRLRESLTGALRKPEAQEAFMQFYQRAMNDNEKMAREIMAVEQKMQHAAHASGSIGGETSRARVQISSMVARDMATLFDETGGRALPGAGVRSTLDPTNWRGVSPLSINPALLEMFNKGRAPDSLGFIDSTLSDEVKKGETVPARAGVGEHITSKSPSPSVLALARERLTYMFDAEGKQIRSETGELLNQERAVVRNTKAQLAVETRLQLYGTAIQSSNEQLGKFAKLSLLVNGEMMEFDAILNATGDKILAMQSGGVNIGDKGRIITPSGKGVDVTLAGLSKEMMAQEKELITQTMRHGHSQYLASAGMDVMTEAEERAMAEVVRADMVAARERRKQAELSIQQAVIDKKNAAAIASAEAKTAIRRTAYDAEVLEQKKAHESQSRKMAAARLYAEKLLEQKYLALSAAVGRVEQVTIASGANQGKWTVLLDQANRGVIYARNQQTGEIKRSSELLGFNRSYKGRQSSEEVTDPARKALISAAAPNIERKAVISARDAYLAASVLPARSPGAMPAPAPFVPSAPRLLPAAKPYTTDSTAIAATISSEGKKFAARIAEGQAALVRLVVDSKEYSVALDADNKVLWALNSADKRLIVSKDLLAKIQEQYTATLLEGKAALEAKAYSDWMAAAENGDVSKRQQQFAAAADTRIMQMGQAALAEAKSSGKSAAEMNAIAEQHRLFYRQMTVGEKKYVVALRQIDENTRELVLALSADGDIINATNKSWANLKRVIDTNAAELAFLNPGAVLAGTSGGGMGGSTVPTKVGAWGKVSNFMGGRGGSAVMGTSMMAGMVPLIMPVDTVGVAGQTVGGIASGAGIGGMMGMMGGPWGALIGTGAGAALGGISGYWKGITEEENKATEAVKEYNSRLRMTAQIISKDVSTAFGSAFKALKEFKQVDVINIDKLDRTKEYVDKVKEAFGPDIEIMKGLAGGDIVNKGTEMFARMIQQGWTFEEANRAVSEIARQAGKSDKINAISIRAKIKMDEGGVTALLNDSMSNAMRDNLSRAGAEENIDRAKEYASSAGMQIGSMLVEGQRNGVIKGTDEMYTAYTASIDKLIADVSSKFKDNGVFTATNADMGFKNSFKLAIESAGRDMDQFRVKSGHAMGSFKMSVSEAFDIYNRLQGSARTDFLDGLRNGMPDLVRAVEMLNSATTSAADGVMELNPALAALVQEGISGTNQLSAYSAMVAALTGNFDALAISISQVTQMRLMAFDAAVASVSSNAFIQSINTDASGNTLSSVSGSSDAADAAQEAAQERQDEMQKEIDSTKEAMDANIEAVKKRYDDEIQRLSDLEDARQKAYDAEQKRIDRDLARKNLAVDYQRAMNTGQFGEAAKIAFQGAANEATWTREDAQENAQSRSEKQIDALQKKRDGEVKSLEDLRDAKIKAMQDALEAQQKADQAATKSTQKAQADSSAAIRAGIEAKKKYVSDGVMSTITALEEGRISWGRAGERMKTISEKTGLSIKGLMQTLTDETLKSVRSLGPEFTNVMAEDLKDIPWNKFGEYVRASASEDVPGMERAFGEIKAWITQRQTGGLYAPRGSIGQSRLPSDERAQGGYISGPGTGTSDSIPARLSNGEYVVKQASVSRYGKGFLDQINAGKYALGGYVGAITDRVVDMGTGAFVSRMVNVLSGIETAMRADSNMPQGDAWKEAFRASLAAGTYTPSQTQTAAPSTYNFTIENLGDGSLGARVIEMAMKHIGEPYVGDPPGARPPLTWDCSKFTGWLYDQVGVHMERFSPAQWGDRKHVKFVPYANALPGDLLFYHFSDGTAGDGRGTVSHVNMLLSKASNKAIGAENPGLGVAIVDVNFGKMVGPPGSESTRAAGRVINPGAASTTGGDPILAPGQVSPFSFGGHVTGPGSGTSDSIPAWLSNGEYVVKQSSVARYGKGFMDKLNDGKIEAGGPISYRPTFDTMKQVVIEPPKPVSTGGSGGATENYNADPRGAAAISRAAALYASQEQTLFNRCLQYVRTWLGVGSKYGSAEEAWNNVNTSHMDASPPSGVPTWWTNGGNGHVALSAGGGKVYTTDMPKKYRIGLVPLSQIARDWGYKYRGWSEDINEVNIYKPGTRTVGGSSGTGGTAPTTGNPTYRGTDTGTNTINLSDIIDNPTQNKAWARQMLAQRGWSDQWNSLYQLWQHESGWHIKSSDGMQGGRMDGNYGTPRTWGVPQSNPGNKMKSAGADWRTNALTQMKWGLNYIRSSYGDPNGAWNFWQRKAASGSYGWYHDGGLVIPSLRTGGTIAYDGTLANLHKQETVLTAPLSQKLNDGIERMESGPSVEYNVRVTIDRAAASPAEIERAVYGALDKHSIKMGRTRVIR